MDRPDPKTQPEAWAEYWRGRIDEAQQQQTIDLKGTKYTRVRCGDEDDHALTLCPDCGVTKDQYHVQRCDQEQCPRCDGQQLSCDCVDDDEEDEDAGAYDCDARGVKTH